MYRASFLVGCGIAALACRAGAPAPLASAAPAPGTAARSHLTVFGITEFTAAGRRFPAPTAGRPVYVMVHYDGRRDYGRPYVGDAAPAEELVRGQLDVALAADHLLPATGNHAPSLVLLLTWGIHASPGAGIDDPGYRNLLDRAALVGGRKFAGELKAVLEQDDMSLASTPAQPWGAQLPGMNPTTPSILLKGFSPLESFRNRNRLTGRLLTQISEDCYYVVVSAFDYAALAGGRSRLLWRTKLSANTRSASLAGAIPALIRRGAGCFGRDMAGPEIISGPSG